MSLLTNELLTSTSGLDTQFQKYMDRKLLGHAKELVVMDQPATKRPLPRNAGATSIRFHRPQKADRTQVQTLTEGTPPTSSGTFVYEKVDATLELFGNVKVISDLLTQTSLFDTLSDVSKNLGEEAAFFADFHITGKVANTNAAADRHYAGTATSFNDLVALTPDNAKMDIDDINRCMSFLTINTAPKLGGEYICIAPPQLTYNLRQDTNFLTAGQYGTSKGLMNGEVGRWYGIRVIESTQPFREANTANTENTYSSTGAIFTAICTGEGGWGCPILAGHSPFSPSLIVNNKPDSANPLAQFTTVGFKAYWTAVLLNSSWVQTLRAKSTLA